MARRATPGRTATRSRPWVFTRTGGSTMCSPLGRASVVLVIQSAVNSSVFVRWANRNYRTIMELPLTFGTDRSFLGAGAPKPEKYDGADWGRR
jgi:hypothetical protein